MMASKDYSSFLMKDDIELAKLVPDTVLFLSIMGEEWREVKTDLSRSRNEFSENSGNPPELIKGALNGNPIVRFSGGTIASLEEDAVPSGESYTIVTLARYNGEKRGRVFSSSNQNWLFGFHKGSQDSLFVGKWLEHGFERDEQWRLHVLRFNSKDRRIFFRSSGKEIVNQTMEENSVITSMGRLSLGGWGKNKDQTSQCDIAYLQVFDRAISDLEIFQIEHAISKKFSLSEDNNQDFINNCSMNIEQFLDNDKIAKYALLNCSNELQERNLIHKIFETVMPSDEEYHKIASIFWESRGDFGRSLEHSYLSFFQSPEDFHSISRLI